MTSHAAATRTAAVPFDRRQLATIGGAMLGFFVVALDAQIVNVALPDIGRTFGAGLSGLQWVVTGYTLAFSALILFAGSVSDRVGARRAYAAGMVLFALASAVCGLAPSAATLIGARIVQGAGAALVTPTSLALIREGFSDARLRARAVGLWAVGGSVAAAAGPIAGGALTLVDWRLIFWVNLPVAVLALVFVSRTAPSARRRVRFDLVGQVSAIVALGAFSYVVIEGGSRGWSSPLIVGLAAAAVIAAGVFGAAQARGRNAMVPPGLFRSRQLSVALVIAFASMAAFYGVVFVQSLYFQQQRGASALLTGLLFLPMTGLVTIVSSQAASLAARFGNRALITTGLLTQCTGLIVIVALPAAASLWAVAAAMVPVGAGGALTVPPIASLVLDHAPSGLAGTASGVLNTFRQLGGSLGVAAIGAIIAGHSVFMNGLRAGLIVTVAVLGVTAALSLSLHKPRNSTLER